MVELLKNLNIIKKLLSLALLSCLLFMSSCKKDDTITNYLSIDGVRYKMPYGYLVNFGGYHQIIFMDGNSLSSFSHYFGVHFNAPAVSNDNIVAAGVYTYSPDEAPDYDRSKHYFDIMYRTPTEEWERSDISESRFEVKKQGQKYIFDYSFKIGEKNFVGHYEGELTLVGTGS